MATAKKKPQPETAADDKQVVMLHSITVPLDSLVPWQGNVRKTESAAGIDEMAASILAHGLIQSLVVRKVGQGKDKGKFELITGRRRYTALMQLAAQGKIADDYKVPCQLIAADASAHEIGLAENTVRVEMNPADQFEAFHQLTTEGKTVADIAAAFGVSETVVNKRLKLANVAPVIINAYRDGILNLEQLQAFSVTDDKKAQKRLFEYGGRDNKIEDLEDFWDASHHYNVRDGKWIRKRLTEGDIRATDKLARFVGVDAYEAAGGKTRRDLFVDDINGIYLLDGKLLNKLAEEKMIVLQESVKGEGWQWVNATVTGDTPDEWQLGNEYEIAQPRSRKPSPEAQAKIDALKERVKELEKPFIDEDGDVWVNDTDVENQIESINDEIEQIERSAIVYAKKTVENGGAVIGLNEYGTPIIIRGLIDKKTAKALEKQSAKKKPDIDANDAPEAPATAEETDDLSKQVLTDLSVHRTYAIGATLMQNPEAGLVNLLYPMALKAFYDSGAEGDLNGVNAQITEMAIPAMVDTHTTDMDINSDEYPVKGYAMLQRAKDKWTEKFPVNEGDVWQYMMGLKLADLAELAALFAGLSYNGFDTYGKQSIHDKILMQKFSIDMTKWYAPGEQNLFARLTKTQLASVIKDIRGTALTAEEANFKKPALAQLAAEEERKRTEAGNPWLPAVLHTPTEEAVTAALSDWTETYGGADEDPEDEERDDE